MNPRGTPLFAEWRARRAGFAPLFFESVMAPALAHLSAGLRPGALVLDLGSGEGHVADAIRACGGRTICLDVDPGVLAASRRRYPGGAHVAGDAARLPLADGSVDAVFGFSVLQYADREAALDELRRVLRPGGRLAVVENLSGSPVALGYRAWRRIARLRLPKRLTPLRHVGWGERARIFRRFPAARFEAACLFAPLLLAVPRVRRADGTEAPDSPVRAGLGAVSGLDTALLRWIPALRHAAWIMLVRA